MGRVRDRPARQVYSLTRAGRKQLEAEQPMAAGHGIVDRFMKISEDPP